jgi:hypothetical protein
MIGVDRSSRRRDNPTRSSSPMRRINSPLVTAAAAVIGALALSTGAAAQDRDAPGGILVFATGGDGRSDKLEIAAVNPGGAGSAS